MSHAHNQHTPPADLRILDLFAGPGGLDVAAEALGYRATGIEWDDDAVVTRSHAGMDTFHGDVRRYRAAFFPHADVLTGGPPCQTFTVAGNGAGRRSLHDVTEHIHKLHEAVRTARAVRSDESRLDAWKGAFRTWRKIYEKLRLNEVLAEEVRVEKRRIEKARTGLRKTMRGRLAGLGHTPRETKDFFKKLKNPQDIRLPDVDLTALLKAYSDLNGELDKARRRLEELGDPRTGLVLQPLWWVIERCLRPGSRPYEAVVLEQVPAVMPVWEEYSRVLRTLGYRTNTQYLHTEAFGVPQTRRRAVLMARFGPGTLAELEATHERYRPGGRDGGVLGEDGEQLPLPPRDTPDSTEKTPKTPRKGWISMETALREAAGAFPERGEFTVVSNYGTGGDPDARGRRDHDTPSATITGKVSRNRLVHKGTNVDLPGGLGRFTNAEAGVLQTFPAAYPWKGKDVAQQIGNAVPPLLALHVLQHVLEPDLDEDGRKERLEEAAERLRTRPASAVPVEALDHKGLKGHPLTGR
ncbi:DNA cytosine methyltransferase [Streptomyces hydrogenans]|uniref:DNA cytosine methyltransferase n=1 Tax=Streptomyces hydrogenans TaxID=1873719 RepID=UPI00278C1B9F|nr:DNA cytosine methyltransferase [Streptomyces hydrogenans]